MIGVDYELFWTLNPKSLSPFIKAFSLKQKYDDTVAWNIGKYVRIAIGSCLSKSTKYPTKPDSQNGGTKDMTADEIKKKMFERMGIINTRFGKEE